MRSISHMRGVTARSGALAAGLVLAISISGLTPSPTAAKTPVINLGVPVSVSLELVAGAHIGYSLSAVGRTTASLAVSFATPEAASATRRYRHNGITYYLLSWGRLAGYWVQPAAGVRLIQATTWKVLVLVYRQTNLDFVDASGQTRHLGATMSAATESLMVGAVQTMPKLTHEWSSGVAAQQMTVVRPPTPLTRLTALGGGEYWLAPEDIAADIALYAPTSAYDSIMVVWQPWDTDDYVPSAGWGLSWPAGAASNGAAYATVTVPPSGDNYWITGQAYPGEPFMHEWLHGVIDYYTSQGSNTPALHANAAYGYTDHAGSFAGWYGDLMRQHVKDPLTGDYVGISSLDWQSGTWRVK
jgi:hypothetical protein